jgi:uncharacterized cupin superfamily protein
MTKKIDVQSTKASTGSRYPAPYHQPCMERVRRRLADAAQLSQFGVNLTRLPAGAWSSQRHWHSAEDEFIYVLEGEVVLVTDSGEEWLRTGDCAGFRANVADGHHLQNRSAKDALYLEVGSRRPDDDDVVYPDIDLKVMAGAGFAHRDGRPY